MGDHLLAVTIVILLLFLIGSYFSRKSSRKEQLRYEKEREAKATFEDHLNTIFVALPTYRDEDECARTLYSLFNNADCPWRVTVGLLHHIDDKHMPDPIDGQITDAAAIYDNIINKYEQLCQQRNATALSQNIRVLVEPISKARGPWAARALIEKELFRKERFYMTVDSHTRFVKSWDAKILALYHQCCQHHRKPIITTRPGAYVRGTDLAEDERPTFTAVQNIDANGFPVLRSVEYTDAPIRCFKAPFYVPNFSFASSNLIKEAPTDPECAFAHRAEVYVQSARYYTHGWDFLQPKEPICYHLPAAKRRNTFEEQLENKANQVLRTKGILRSLAVLRRDPCSVCGTVRDEHTPAHGLGHNFESEFPDTSSVHRTDYTLGTARTLADFEEHCGFKIPGKAEAFSRIGCCKNTSVEEKLAKYGRVEAYDLLLKEFKESVVCVPS